MIGLPHKKARRQPGLVDTKNTTTAATLAKKAHKSNGCCCLADTIAELGASEYEIDRLLDAITYLENVEQQRWECARISVRQAVAYLKRIGLATPALAAWRCWQ